MGIRQFFRSLRSTRGAPRPAEPEDHLARDVRDAMGPQSSSGSAGMTGESVYHYLDDHEHTTDDD